MDSKQAQLPYKKLASLLAYVTLCVLCGNGQAGVANTVDFKLLHGYLIVIPVTVNGVGPVEFLLDTGTSTTLLSAEFARQFNLRYLDRVELVTVTGMQLLARSQVAGLSVGTQTAMGLEVLISDLREVRAALPNVRGVLGQNFLAQFNYLIDYQARRLVFEECGDLATGLQGERMSLESHNDRLLVSIPSAAANWRFVPDTGIAQLVLFVNSTRLANLDWQSNAPAISQVRSDSGSRFVQQRYLRRLQLGRASFVDLPVALLTPEQSSEGRIEDGLLPLSLFRRVYFNPTQRFLILNPIKAK